MLVMTYSEARKNFATVLDTSKIEGNVIIRRADGSEFNITPRKKVASPFYGVKQVVHIKKSAFSKMLDDMRSEGENRF